MAPGRTRGNHRFFRDRDFEAPVEREPWEGKPSLDLEPDEVHGRRARQHAFVTEEENALERERGRRRPVRSKGRRRVTEVRGNPMSAAG